MRSPTATQKAVDQLANEILEGRYASVPLPSERELAEQLAMSRATVREVLSRLEKRGLIDRQHGRGTFARPLAELSTRPVAMLLREPHKTSGFYMSELIRGATSTLEAAHASLSITSTPPERWPTSFIESCGGVLIIPTQVGPADIETLQNLGCPFITIAEAQLPGPCIRLQLEAAAEQITQVLLEEGHRHFAMLSGHDQHSEQVKRQGIRNALEAAGIDFDTVPDFQTRYDPVEADAAATRLLELTPRPTAVIGFDDDLAMHAVAAAQRIGLAVPEQMSVVGFNDAPFADLLLPRLTTVRLPIYQAGEAGAEALQRVASQGGRPRSRTLDYEIVLRDSVAEAP